MDVECGLMVRQLHFGGTGCFGGCLLLLHLEFTAGGLELGLKSGKLDILCMREPGDGALVLVAI